MVNLNGVVFTPATSKDMVVLTRKCPFCGKEHSITVEATALKQGLTDIQHGELIQNALPTFSASEREFLMSGICDMCFDTM